MTAAQHIVWAHEAQDHGTRGTRRDPSKDTYWTKPTHRMSRSARERTAIARGLEGTPVEDALGLVTEAAWDDAESAAIAEIYLNDDSDLPSGPSSAAWLPSDIGLPQRSRCRGYGPGVESDDFDEDADLALYGMHIVTLR